jgi:hypothetical protein
MTGREQVMPDIDQILHNKEVANILDFSKV